MPLHRRYRLTPTARQIERQPTRPPAAPPTLPAELTFTVPAWPPSVNHLYGRRGPRTFKTAAGKNWQALAILAIRQAKGWPLPTIAADFPRPAELAIAITIAGTPGRGRRRDLDNFLKATLDAITAARIWDDDSQARTIRITRHPIGQQAVTVTITNHV
jgi:crossover junction endodeoxyribonuclease RusA